MKHIFITVLCLLYIKKRPFNIELASVIGRHSHFTEVHSHFREADEE